MRDTNEHPLSLTETGLVYLVVFTSYSSTYDHRVWKIGLPVRSAVLKPHAGELVVGWVTTSESSLLYVFFSFCSFRVREEAESSNYE
jgi:hypothetical protein